MYYNNGPLLAILFGLLFLMFFFFHILKIFFSMFFFLSFSTFQPKLRFKKLYADEILVLDINGNS